MFSKRFKTEKSRLQFLLQHHFLLFIRKRLSWDAESLDLFSKLTIIMLSCEMYWP